MWLACCETGLEAVMIGNAISKNAGESAEIRKVAAMLGAVIFKPYYPPGDFPRLYADNDALQLNFLTEHNGRSYDAVRRYQFRWPGKS